MLPHRGVLALALAACQSDMTATDTAATVTAAGTTDAATGSTAAALPTPTSTTTTTTHSTSDGPDASTGDASTGAAACGAGGVDACCCFSVAGEPDHPVLSVACVADDAPCDAPQATCPEDQVECDAGDLQVTSAAGLDCVLQALADREGGAVSWAIDGAGGLTGSSHTLFVQTDGTAFASSYIYDDAGYSYTGVERRALQPAAYFSDCVAAPSDGERFACLQHATVGAATETCVDGFTGAIGR